MTLAQSYIYIYIYIYICYILFNMRPVINRYTNTGRILPNYAYMELTNVSSYMH
jgi:hypothetical protein